MDEPRFAPRPPVAWRLLFPLAGLRLAFLLVLAGRYGIFRDEYYYLACASHPDWGYVDQPALSIWLLSLWRGVFGDSVLSIRILPALAGAAAIPLLGLLVAELGGKWRAQLLAGLAICFGMVHLVLSSFYSMNVFDFLFWMAGFVLICRVLRDPSPRNWVWLGLLLGVGLLNKLSLLVFGAALASGLLLTPQRALLRTRGIWTAGILALLLLVPYLLWNATHEWPTLEFIRNAKQYKISSISPLGFLAENVLEANPLTLPLWLAGLFWLLLARRARGVRLLAWMYLIALAIMLLQKSKPYYLGPAYTPLLAAGCVALELASREPRRRWLLPTYAVALVVGSLPLLPMALPLLGPQRTLEHLQALGIAPNTGEVSHTGALPQYLSDRLGWEELAALVAELYGELPEGDRGRCVVLTSNYGQAGALQYWSREFELPPVYSGHNNYWFWGPPEGGAEVVLTVGLSRSRLEGGFESVEDKGVRDSPLAQESQIPIRICRRPRLPREALWRSIRSFI